MKLVNWLGPQSDLDVHKAVNGVNKKRFDKDGLMDCLVQYRNYKQCRVSPNPGLNMGRPQEVVIRCRSGIPLSGQMVTGLDHVTRTITKKRDISERDKDTEEVKRTEVTQDIDVIDEVPTQIWVPGPYPNFVAVTDEELDAILQDLTRNFAAPDTFLASRS